MRTSSYVIFSNLYKLEMKSNERVENKNKPRAHSFVVSQNENVLGEEFSPFSASIKGSFNLL